MGIEGTYFKITEDTYDRPTANIIVNCGKLKTFLLRSGTRKGCPLLPPLFNIVFEVLATAITEEKEIKVIQLGKEEAKRSLFSQDTILYTENPKDATRKLLELINELGKFAGYKSNRQKSFAFVYTNKERSEMEIKETIPFTINSKRIKHLEINVPKEATYLYSENYKMLMKQIKHDTNRWKDIPCFLIGRISILKMTILPKVIYRLNTIPIITNGIFQRTRTKFFEICMKTEKTLK